MKKLFVLFAFLLSYSWSFAQSFGEMEWQKTKIPAVVLEIPQTASVTQDAILKKLAQLGYNGKETKDVIVYKGIRITEISIEPLDIYLSVGRKSRKEKDACTVNFAVSGAPGKFIKAGDDAILIQKINAYVNNFPAWAEAEALERDIKDQEDKLKGAEKKSTDLQEESESLQKRLKKLNEDIEQNKKDIEKQKTEVENQRKALDILKAKRKF
ncbi:MAG: coiled-coil domain-containing protein [Chitinophagaceae bacterium]